MRLLVFLAIASCAIAATRDLTGRVLLRARGLPPAALALSAAGPAAIAAGLVSAPARGGGGGGVVWAPVDDSEVEDDDAGDGASRR
jgi:hypothetical protein